MGTSLSLIRPIICLSCDCNSLSLSLFVLIQLLRPDCVVPRHDQVPAEAGVLVAHQGFRQGESRTRHLQFHPGEPSPPPGRVLQRQVSQFPELPDGIKMNILKF